MNSINPIGMLCIKFGFNCPSCSLMCKVYDTPPPKKKKKKNKKQMQKSQEETRGLNKKPERHDSRLAH